MLSILEFMHVAIGNGRWVLIGNWNTHNGRWSIDGKCDTVGRIVHEWRRDREVWLVKAREHNF